MRDVQVTPAFCRQQFALADLEEQKAHGEFTGVEYEPKQLQELESLLAAPVDNQPSEVIDKVLRADTLKVGINVVL